MFKPLITALVVAAGIGLGAAQPASAMSSGVAANGPAVSLDIVPAGVKRSQGSIHFRGRHIHGRIHFRGQRGGHCGYFLGRAQKSGKTYWWKKYRRCVGHGHYYAY